jgi:uracil phosphoribosyltransferase
VAELRDQTTDPEAFRRYARHLTTLLVIEATRHLALESVRVQTPLEFADCERLNSGLAAVPILRAGLIMLEPVTELFPDVKVGYIGLARDESTAVAYQYYEKLPELTGRHTLCLDPMLATGGSASQALGFIKAKGAPSISLVCVVAAPEGVARIEHDHPDVAIVAAVLDRGLDPRKYILPGLGDFGDRLYGTF